MSLLDLVICLVVIVTMIFWIDRIIKSIIDTIYRMKEKKKD